jgi:hypothetical protein
MEGFSRRTTREAFASDSNGKRRCPIQLTEAESASAIIEAVHESNSNI